MSSSSPPPAEYKPASRRPIAQAFRATAHLAVRLCVKLGVHPDAVSYLSIVAAAGAGACFLFSGARPWLVIPAALLCYVRLWLNMLDGMVALASGKASPRGEILNDLPDRASDVIIFAGVAHSGWCNPFIAYWAAIFAVLTAYVGTLGQAVAGRREYGGIMSKPWRMVALHVGSWLMFATRGYGYHVDFYKLTIMDLTLILILLGCVQAMTVRLARTMRELRNRSARSPGSVS